MAAGFDANIILQGMRQGPDALETMRSLQGLVQQRQAHDMSLGGLLEKQNQERVLRDIYRTNGADPNALMSAGFGPEAYQAQDHASQLALRDAQAKKASTDLVELARQHVRNQVAAVKTPEQYAQLVAGVPPDVLRNMSLPERYDPAALELFVAGGIPAEKRADMEQRGQTLEEAKRHNRAMEGRPSGAPPLVLVPGANGFVWANPRDPSAPAVPVKDSTGAQVTKPGTGASGGKQLSATALSELADYDTAQTQLDELFTKARKENISGLGARANQVVTDALGLQGTDAARFEGASAPVRQGVGTILEGGKLAAGDEAKYKNMLPKYGDSLPVLDEKQKALNKYLATRKAERIKALGSGGYAVPGSKAGASSGASADPKVTAAMEWLKANPNHPKAAGVRDGLKARGFDL